MGEMKNLSPSMHRCNRIYRIPPTHTIQHHRPIGCCWCPSNALGFMLHQLRNVSGYFFVFFLSFAASKLSVTMKWKTKCSKCRTGRYININQPGLRIMWYCDIVEYNRANDYLLQLLSYGCRSMNCSETWGRGTVSLRVRFQLPWFQRCQMLLHFAVS